MITEPIDLEEYNGEESQINDFVDDIRILKDSDEMMENILLLLNEFDRQMVVPQVGTYTTFIYSPKTPRIRYDRNPLVAVTELHSWGFTGINYHWGKFRNYTWAEVDTHPHLILPSELRDMRSIPYQNYKINRS